MNLDRLGNITSELSSSLLRSILLPGGLREWFSKPIGERVRDLQRSRRPEARTDEEIPAVRPAEPLSAPVVLFGGHPVPDVAVVELLHLAGGRAARFAVVPLSTDGGEDAGADSLRLLTRFGMRNSFILPLSSREQADRPEVVAELAACDGVLICGTDAALSMSLLADTYAAQAILTLAAAGKVVAGLEAGATILGEQFLAVSDSGELQMVQGLGLLPGFVSDHRFTERGRFGTLAKALQNGESKSLTAAGIDAGAALVIRSGEARVYGDGTVTFLDGREAEPVPDENCTGAVCGLRVHVLMEGFGMNLRTKKPFSVARLEPVSVAASR